MVYRTNVAENVKRPKRSKLNHANTTVALLSLAVSQASDGRFEHRFSLCVNRNFCCRCWQFKRFGPNEPVHFLALSLFWYCDVI